MNEPGASADLLIRARSAMLDALAALEAHRAAVIVIGAQAVYLRTAAAPVALAEATKDSDLAVDPRELGEDPLIEEAMTRAGFYLNPHTLQPGSWLSPTGIPVDLMVPEALAGSGGSQARGARIPPHSKKAARRAAGLEAALVDNSPMEVLALDPADARRYTIKVAGCGALLVAKLHKIGERVNDRNPDRLQDKDAHDIYRILIDTETDVLAESLEQLRVHEVSAAVTEIAIGLLQQLFGDGPSAIGALMAGRAETGIGNPETVALQASFLADDLSKAVQR
ncbi:hypothetical protein [Microlunatus sp. GCM10028923]|uniref:hypothetical protein n=1 Tax=Microlunatus sp. GCM10028923 TaxID=3273400 RepID=UPI0036193806